MADVIFSTRNIFTRWVIEYLLVFREGAVRTDRIDEDQVVTGIAVIKIVIDAFLFHQATDEIEIRFAILHTVLTLLIRTR